MDKKVLKKMQRFVEYNKLRDELMTFLNAHENLVK